mgnify:CR=1 FL=1
MGHTWICGGGALFGQVGIFGNPRLSNSQNLKQFRCFTGFLLFFPLDWMYLGYFKRGSEVFDKIPPPNKKYQTSYKPKTMVFELVGTC